MEAGDLRDIGLICSLGRSPGEGYGNPLQYSCLENPMDRGAWQATVHRVARSWTQLKRISTHARTIETFVSSKKLAAHVTFQKEFAAFIYLFFKKAQ